MDFVPAFLLSMKALVGYEPGNLVNPKSHRNYKVAQAFQQLILVNNQVLQQDLKAFIIQMLIKETLLLCSDTTGKRNCE
jgi:hypothetical protein